MRVPANYSHAYAAAGIAQPAMPLLVVAAGQSNMVGWKGAENGPFFKMNGVHIWDVRTESFLTADLRNQEYSVYCGDDGAHLKTIGGGRNNLAAAFGYRLRRETDRPVYLVFNCTGGRDIHYWLGYGRASPDWRALNHDLQIALPQLGLTKIDYFLWQQDEPKRLNSQLPGAHEAMLASLREQAMSEAWWGPSSRMVIGKPSLVALARADALLMNDEIDAFREQGHDNVSVANATSPWFANNPYPTSDENGLYLTGRSLYSLGYFNYFDALTAADSRTEPFGSAFQEWPYPSEIDATPPPRINRNAQYNSRYNLAPSITRVGPRFFVGYTSNPINPGEGEGQVAKVSWTDDEWTTLVGTISFEDSNAAEPCLWSAPDGSLWCFLMASHVESQVFDGKAGVWLSICRNPMSQRPEFSAPTQIVKFGWCQPPVNLRNQWFLPVDYWRFPRGGGYRPFVPALAGRYLMSIDWKDIKVAPSIVVSSETRNSTYDETGVYKLCDGRLRAIWRTLDGPMYSDTTESGDLIWTTPSSFTPFGVNRPSSRHRIKTSPSGQVLFAWNDATDRSNLTLALTGCDSHLEHFKKKLVLQQGPSAYPDIYADGVDVWVAYDSANRRTPSSGDKNDGAGQIRVAKIKESALVADGQASVTTFVVEAGIGRIDIFRGSL